MTALTLYFTDVLSNPVTNDVFYRALVFQSPREQHRILRYRDWHDRYRALGGVALAHYALKRHLRMAYTPSDCLRESSGRPYSVSLKNRGGDFNISHHGPWVVCAVLSCGRVGIDLAMPSEFDLAIATVCLGEEELAFVRTLPTVHQPRDIAKLWALKEALMKMKGAGLAIEPKS
jgi:phosphopantetheinyl transferase